AHATSRLIARAVSDIAVTQAVAVLELLIMHSPTTKPPRCCKRAGEKETAARPSKRHASLATRAKLAGVKGREKVPGRFCITSALPLSAAAASRTSRRGRLARRRAVP